MTFKVTILGSSAALPIRGKHHSAHALNVHEQFYLVDCGEGTQTRLGECGISPLKLNAVFITHLHGDHLYGLFPLISTLSLLGRKTPLDVFAPNPLGDLMKCMDNMLGDGPAFEVRFHPVDTRQHTMVYENKVMEVWTVPLRHRVPSAGYIFREKQPALNVRKDKIDYYGLDISHIVALKRGEDITLDNGRMLANQELTYIPYELRSYAYCSDTMVSGKVASLVEGVDLLYHEATFAAADKPLAKQTGHSTTVQAAEIALKAGAGRLLIGHFSGRYKDTSGLIEEARAVFPNTEEAVEGRCYDIPLKHTLDMSRTKIIATPSELRTERQFAAEKNYESLASEDRLTLDGFIAGLQGEFGQAMDERYGRLIVEKDLWSGALDLAFHEDGRVAFRVSWALEWAYFNHREAFVPFVARFFENYLVATNASVHRHYTKMLCDMMRCGLFVPDTAQAEQVAEKTFDLLIGQQTKSAVRVWAAEILYELSPRFDWVSEHLEAVLRQQMETIPTPAIVNHYSKVLKRITGAKNK